MYAMKYYGKEIWNSLHSQHFAQHNIKSVGLVIPVSVGPAHLCRTTDTPRGSHQGCRVHTERWWGWKDGSPSCSSPDLQHIWEWIFTKMFTYMSVDADALHILLRTCHEDLRSQGAALQACVSTMSWHRDCRDWNSVEKENRLRLEEREKSAVDSVNVDFN